MGIGAADQTIERSKIMDNLVAWVLGIWATTSWITHVIVCLKLGKWGFLIAGALMFPVAIVHGTNIWFGIW